MERRTLIRLECDEERVILVNEEHNTIRVELLESGHLIYSVTYFSPYSLSEIIFELFDKHKIIEYSW